MRGIKERMMSVSHNFLTRGSTPREKEKKKKKENLLSNKAEHFHTQVLTEVENFEPWSSGR
jgi:hypothetical protein